MGWNPGTKEYIVSFSGAFQLSGMPFAPFIAPTIEPTVAPLQSVSNPPDTAAVMPFSKSPSDQRKAAVHIAAFGMVCTQLYFPNSFHIAS